MPIFGPHTDFKNNVGEMGGYFSPKMEIIKLIIMILEGPKSKILAYGTLPRQNDNIVFYVLRLSEARFINKMGSLSV